MLTLDVHDLAVVDDRALGGELPATVTLQVTWKGGGRLRDLTGSAPAFAGRFFRRARARGTFGASEDGFAFTSPSQRPARSNFAELGTEMNGTFLAAALSCPHCSQEENAPW